MKKYLVSAFVAIAAIAFVSCSGSDSDSKGDTKTTLPTLDTSTAKYISGIASTGAGTTPEELKLPGSVRILGGESVLPEAAVGDGAVLIHNERIGKDDPGKGKVKDLTAEVAVVEPVLSAPLKAIVNPWEFEYVLGTYTVEGNNYTIPGYGVITITGNGTDLTFKFEGDETPVTATGTNNNYSLLNSQVALWLCRPWTVKSTFVEITKGATVGKKFQGCDFEAIVNDLSETLSFKAEKAQELKDLGAISQISFSRAGLITFYFTKAAALQIYSGDVKLNADNTFSWKFEGDAGNDFIKGNGTGKVAFKGNTAIVTLDVDFEGSSKAYAGSIEFELEAVR